MYIYIYKIFLSPNNILFCWTQEVRIKMRKGLCYSEIHNCTGRGTGRRPFSPCPACMESSCSPLAPCLCSLPLPILRLASFSLRKSVTRLFVLGRPPTPNLRSYSASFLHSITSSLVPYCKRVRYSYRRK
jgi:hypothetical protein